MLIVVSTYTLIILDGKHALFHFGKYQFEISKYQRNESMFTIWPSFYSRAMVQPLLPLGIIPRERATKGSIKMSTRLGILKSYIFPIFTYGCEAWTLSKVLEQKIETFENWCFRTMGKIKWSDYISNEKVLTMLKTKRTLLKDIQKRKLRYFGHIKRKKNLLSTAVEGRVKGRRPRGRPRNTWFTDVKEWTGLPGHEITRMAAQRDLWGVISRQPSSRRWHPQVNSSALWK